MNRERLTVVGAVCVLFYFAVDDVFEDINNGENFNQITLDLTFISLVTALLAYVYILQPLKTRHSHRLLQGQRKVQDADLKRLSKVADAHLQGLAVYIKAQFDEWALTPAEQDVALLLLKGLSMKEIAKLRGVSERTARQQATLVYSKSSVPGRAGLSAYFLEDLLLPADLN